MCLIVFLFLWIIYFVGYICYMWELYIDILCCFVIWVCCEWYIRVRVLMIRFIIMIFWMVLWFNVFLLLWDVVFKSRLMKFFLWFVFCLWFVLIWCCLCLLMLIILFIFLWILFVICWNLFLIFCNFVINFRYGM